MRIKHLDFLLDKGLIIIELFILVFFLYWRLRLGLTRYFDIDEYAHLHWAFNFFSGLKPYKDYLYFFPPLYLFILYPLFVIAGKTIFLLTLARVQAFVIYIFLVSVIFLLVRKVRGVQTALLTLVIFAFMPLPSDKLLEIRPDNISTAFAFLGIYLLIKSFKDKNFIFWSGLSYGLALMIVPKVIFFLPAVFLFVLVSVVQRYRDWGDVGKFCLGFLPPFLFTLIFFIAMGNPAQAIYYSTKFISSASKILGDKFPMLPNLFFYPNDIFYGEFGINPILVMNLIIYVTASIWGIIRLVSFLDRKDMRESLIELLLSVTFIANIIAYIKYFPLKHTQYFITFAPLVAFFFADMLVCFAGALKKKAKIFFSVILIIFLIYILHLGLRMYTIKGRWTNESYFADLKKTQNLIPADEYVLDLYGASIFYKDPYYICCISYGEFTEAFRSKLPSLPEALERTQTKYIFLLVPYRINMLPPIDVRFLKEHYITINENNPAIMAAGVVANMKGDEERVELISAGNYRIFWNGREVGKNDRSALYIDGKKIDESPLYLAAGDHKARSALIGELKIVYLK